MTADHQELISLLQKARDLAARYYDLTGKPLGITGEIAEFEAASKLNLTLLSARAPLVDACRKTSTGPERFQIKGRAVAADDRYRGRVPSIRSDGDFDYVVLVLLDRRSYAALEIWQADRRRVKERLDTPGSRARNERRSMAITQFKSIATRVWPDTDAPS